MRTLNLSGNNVLTGPEGDDEAVENAATAMKVCILFDSEGRQCADGSRRMTS